MGYVTSENTDRLASVVNESINETDSFPYRTEYPSLALSCINNDTALTLKFSIVTTQGKSIDIVVPPLVSFSDYFPEFNQIVMNTITNSFNMVIKVSSRYHGALNE